MMWRVGEWLAVLWPRSWWYSWRQARHVIRVTEEEAGYWRDEPYPFTPPGWVFRGSMNLDDERATLNGLPVYGVPGVRGNWASAPEYLPAPAAGWDELGERLLPAPPDDDEGDATAAWFASLNDDASHREDAQGRDVRVCATEPRPAAGADLTGSLFSRPPEDDPGPPAHGGPGLPEWRAEQLAWVQDVNAWLYEWVRDMVPHVTGWSTA